MVRTWIVGGFAPDTGRPLPVTPPIRYGFHATRVTVVASAQVSGTTIFAAVPDVDLEATSAVTVDFAGPNTEVGVPTRIAFGYEPSEHP